jgi:2-methylcitrate dehydratase PrpD
LLAGRTSASGVMAAALAKAGASGPREPFRHPAGFARLFNENAFDVSPIGELGRVWRLLSPGIDVKNYPVCLSAHAAMDAVADLAARHGFLLDDIEEIVCDVPPVVVANLGYALPRTTREAQFSMPFAISGILRFGCVGLDQLTPAALDDEVVQALMPRVRLTSGPAWNEARLRDAPEGADVTIRMRHGDSFVGSCANARGTAVNPLRPEELEAKFLGCTEPVLGADRAGALLCRLHGLDRDHPSRAVLHT